ncbi:FtsK/SpoIIIE domain-containing protein [Bacillus altitudinis]|uniref:FtsK/SpoIIIE domain-containing protein n=1 Tax=Bacillus TaxID=1386 RepID=UPI0021068CF5|nr:FtsK/SpoIIIE domain-containing protein [Bacillus sp. FS02]
MLKRTRLRTERQQNGMLIFSIAFLLSTTAILVNYIDSQLELGVTKYFNSLFIGFMITIFSIQITIWLIRNKAYRSIKFAIYHYLTVLKLRKSFLDSSYYNKRFYFNNEVANLPKIKIDFSDDFSKAKLFIENININKDISNVNISFALNNFIVDRAYLSNDENYHVFEIYDSNIDQQLKFNSFGELKKQSAQVGDYTLLIDKSINISLYGTLLVGQTGSGKTYALYSLILQMLTKNVHYNIYFADPKNSSLAVLGEKISKENTATDIEDIIELLKRFNEIMIERKAKIKEKLNMKLEGTYADSSMNHISLYLMNLQVFKLYYRQWKRRNVMKL